MILYDLAVAGYHCHNIPGDFRKIQKLADTFASPRNFVINIGKDILFNGKSIYKEILAAIEAYKADPRDYNGFGYNIGKAAGHIFIGEEGEKMLKQMNQREIALI